MVYDRAAMRRLLHPSASVVSLVLLSFVATSLPRDAWYAHRHDGDAQGHAHVAGRAQAGRSSASVRDFLHHDHAHGQHHAHGHRHDHDHDHVPATARTSEREQALDRHDEQAPPVARASSDEPAFAARGDGLHAHWQAPFQTAAITALRHTPPVALAVAPAGLAPVAAPVERARAPRPRSAALSRLTRSPHFV